MMFKLDTSDSPWGDYGDILRHGLVYRDSTETSPLMIERCGSYVPPITQPFCTTVVTDEFMEKIRGFGITGADFRPVKIIKGVKINWHEWDQEAEDPKFYPRGGEPENYIRLKWHSRSTVKQMPKLWELHPKLTEGLQFVDGTFNSKLYSSEDICKSEKISNTYVSERFGAFLRENAGDWIKLEIAE